MGIRGTRLNKAAEIRAGAQLAGQELADLVTGPVVEINLGDLDGPDAIEARLDDPDQQLDKDMVFVYLTRLDDSVRPSHAALHGTEWELDDPELPLPPLGPGCRCRVELRARNRPAERRTGIERAPKNPPEPGGEAMEQFWKEAKKADGEPVTPKDTLGERRGKLVESGEVNPDALIGSDGEIVSAAEAQGIAKAGGTIRAARKVLASSAQLQGIGVTVAQARRFAAEAKDIGGPIVDALVSILVRERPGFIGASTTAATTKRAKEAAKRIVTVLGL